MEEGLALPGELGARDGMSRVMRRSLDGKASELGNRKAGSRVKGTGGWQAVQSGSLDHLSF